MRLSLRVFLFIVLSVAILAPVTYLGPTEIARWQQVQRRTADQELVFAAESLARAIGQAIENSVRGLSATANHIGSYGTFDPPVLQKVLHDYCSSFPSCLGVNICGLDARPFVIEPAVQSDVRFSDRAYYQEMERTGRTAISGVEMGRITRVPTIHVCAPIWVTGKDGTRTRVASLVNAIGLGYLQELTTRSVGVFGDTRAQVLDREKRLIVDSHPRGQAALTDLGGNSMFADVPAGQVLLRTGHHEDGEAVRLAVARLTEQQLDWTVAVMRPAWRIEEQAARSRLATLIAVLGALGLCMALAFVLSSWLAQPISRLAQYTRRVTAGDDVPPPLPAKWDAREVADVLPAVAAMVTRLRHQADALVERGKEQVLLAQLRRELEIAERIQTGILPRSFATHGFESAASMRPAENVGGDYYDIVPTASGLWVGVGDVSGHGLTAGLIVLMLQSALGALLTHAPLARPATIWGAVNRLLVGNIRSRMRGDEHVTLVLTHIDRDGRYAFVGGHEPFIVLKATAAKCEIHPTPGPWMGIRPDLEAKLTESTGSLASGDLLVFYSDGIVEAGTAQRNPFGIERLCAAIERLRFQPAQTICSEIVQEARAWTARAQEDDMTVVVIRKVAVAPEPIPSSATTTTRDRAT